MSREPYSCFFNVQDMKDLYGLIGYPLIHSFSKAFFNDKFKSENIPAEYINFEIPRINDFKEVVFSNPSLKGLNVTIPYKQAVIPFLDDLDERAARIGAVNVIKFVRSGEKLKLVGYNSDVIGFSDSIGPMLTDKQNCALVLGTGGASKAVYAALTELGLTVRYVSRTLQQEGYTYDQLTPEIIEAFKVIVNTTPLGMYPHIDQAPDLPYDCLTTDHLLYDLIYNPDETLFMKKGRQKGATVKNGLEMLLLQAFAAWEIWHK